MIQTKDSILCRFVTLVLERRGVVMHQARVKAMAMLLQGLVWLRQASLSGMGRGVVLLNPETTFIGQLQRAHRLMKNPEVNVWEVGAALYAHMTQGLGRVVIAVERDAGGAVQGVRGLSGGSGTRDSVLSPGRA